ncbi:tetratricopeptide repeat protein [Pendulispora brunnea]|uniref:Tetratricopeptide repeat protein n=1 Tax=Pendulispora brunnea TaxID=2905690 RepID=A0ABZ2K6Q4_9BACT
MSSSSVVPSLTPTTILHLPISSICSKEAEAHYRAGLTAVQGASWEVASTEFQKATVADPTCPEAAVQLSLITYAFNTITEVREQYRRALSLRDAMSERDRAMLDALSPLILSEPADRSEWARRLDVLAERFPLDAQILYNAGRAHMMSATSASEVEHVLDVTIRSLTIDPRYADSWQQEAQALIYLGKYDEAIAALDKCLEVAPGAADCLTERITARQASGQCGEIAADARRWIATVPSAYWSYVDLANALFLEGAPTESVELALEQARNNYPGPRRDIFFTRYRIALTVLNGDLAKAEELSQQLIELARDSSMEFDRLNASAFMVDLLIETGRGEAAAKLAEQVLRRKGALADGYWPAKDEPFLWGTLLARDKITLSRWQTETDLWAARVHSNFTLRQLWGYRWGPVSTIRDLAQQAWSQRPNELASASLLGERREARSQARLAEGRIALAVGENEEAVAVLESATKNCNGIHNPLYGPRAYYWLGQAKERVNDAAGACAAYDAVLKIWGKAKPRSLTADDARKRVRALGCKR